jgi:hypothetical protein
LTQLIQSPTCSSQNHLMFSLIEGIPSEYWNINLSHKLTDDNKRLLMHTLKALFLKTRHWNLVNSDYGGSLLQDYVNSIFAYYLMRQEYDNITPILWDNFYRCDKSSWISVKPLWVPIWLKLVMFLSSRLFKTKTLKTYLQFDFTVSNNANWHKTLVLVLWNNI